MRHLPIKEYLRIKEIRHNATGRFSNEKEVVILNGVEMTVEEFDKMLPPPSSVGKVTSFTYYPKGDNSDKTKGWMNDVKSY